MKKKWPVKVLISITGLVLLLVGTLQLVKSRLGSGPGGEMAQEVSVGTVLPDLSVQRWKGEEALLSGIAGKVFLVNFWATWCEACMTEMPSIRKLHEEFRSQGLEVLAVNLDENPDAVIPAVLKKLGLEFSIFTDPKNELARFFNVHAIPYSLVMNKERKVLYIETGDRDWFNAEMRGMVKEWLKPASTK